MAVFLEHHVQAHFVADFVKGVSLDDFRAHFGQETLVGVGVLFEKVLRHDGAEDSVAEEFQALVVLHGVGFFSGRSIGFVRKGKLKNV